RRREDDIAYDLPARASERLRRSDVERVRLLHASQRAYKNGKHRPDRDQEVFWSFAETEPEQCQGQPSNARYRTQNFNKNINCSLCEPRQTDGHAESDASRGAEGKPDKYTLETYRCMLDKRSGDQQLSGGTQHCHRSREHVRL